MENRDWKIIKLLAQEKNITKAAENLYMSQPALTKRIQQFESEFGVQLVQRGRRGIHFTPEGEYLALCAEDILTLYRQIKDTIANMQKTVSGTLRVGASNYFTRFKLPRILKLYKERYPNVEFQVKSGWGSDIYKLMYNQEIHVAFIRGNYEWSDRKRLISEETLCVASSTPFDLNDLPRLPRIVYKADNKFTQWVNQWWYRNYSVPPYIGMEVDKSDTCKEMVLNGLGYAILARSVLDDSVGLQTIDLTDQDGVPLKRETWMFYHDDFLKLNVLRTFVEFVESMDHS
ncbi:LysR family transcriptional regulator [Paenibacillus hamazuiensis]|uniref:LysR family transcriptional regulator n=1 Tax=Paenibacillus hamazuiensis TaxID=2936508 RepID=UPI00200E615F|nr:LysR family transcriptional regulator [Paenibacillus hamazuiensis]